MLRPFRPTVLGGSSSDHVCVPLSFALRSRDPFCHVLGPARDPRICCAPSLHPQALLSWQTAHRTASRRSLLSLCLLRPRSSPVHSDVPPQGDDLGRHCCGACPTIWRGLAETNHHRPPPLSTFSVNGKAERDHPPLHKPSTPQTLKPANQKNTRSAPILICLVALRSQQVVNCYPAVPVVLGSCAPLSHITRRSLHS